MKAALPALLLAGLLAAATPSSAPEAESPDAVRERLDTLVRFGPRPSGSEGNLRAADWIARELREAGFEVRIQEGLGSRAEIGTAGWARNVVGWLPARGPSRADPDGRDAVLVATHYDSIDAGDGGGDNAASVAAALVAAEELASRPSRERPALFLFTDAEERGLLGAELFVRAEPLARRVAAVLNVDNAGRTLPLLQYEATAPSRALLRALWALPAGRGSARSFSFAADVYRVLPFDTDFTALRALGVPGLNLALVGDGYGYHSAHDRGADVRDEALLAVHRTLGGLLERLVVRGEPLRESTADYAVFFPIGPVTLRLTRGALLGLALLAAVLAVMAIVAAARRDGRGVLRAFAALVVAAVLGLVLTVGVMAGLRAVKGVDQVAYAHPWPLFVLLATIVVGALLLSDTLLRNKRTTASARLTALLPLWLVVVVASTVAAPASAGFFLFPLAALAAAALIVGRRATWAAAVAFGICAIVLLAVWAEPLAIALPFLMTAVTKIAPEPLAFWPAISVVLGLLVLAPVTWAFVPAAGHGRKRAWVAVAVVAVGAAAAVLLRPAYDATHAQKAYAFHVTTPARAYWMLAALDRLEGLPEARRGAGPEQNDLFWLTRGWSRWIRDSTFRVPGPEVQVRREGEETVIDVAALPGVDFLSLVVEGARLRATDPPTRHLDDARVVLRQVVSGDRPARFRLAGALPPGARVRLLSARPGLPAPDRLPVSPARVNSQRALVVTEVPPR